jgi:choline-sulfatase
MRPLAPPWRPKAAALGLFLVASGCARPERPNLVLVTIDTLRADHTTVYGYARETTPVLARLAREGAVVDRAYAPMATTGPSHATLMTSLYPLTHGFLRNGERLSESQITLAERLKAAGYRTSGVVSSFVLKQNFGFAQGFGSFDARFDVASSTTHLDGWEGKDIEGQGFDRRADKTTDIALDWLEKRQRDKPFFLWVHYYDPHSPYAPPPPFDAQFPAPEPTALSRAVAAYDGEIAFVDQQLGRLVAAIDAQGIARNTLVAVTSDHGEGLMQHGHMAHGLQLYEEAVHVPLVFRWPGHLQAGLRLPGPVEHVDLAPTVMDLLRVPWGEGESQGQSLAAALTGAQGVAGRDPRRMVFLQRRLYDTEMVSGFHVKGAKFAVRARGLKYIEALEEGTRELYDLDRDPGETANLLDARTDDGKRLAALIAAWRAHHDRGVRAPDDTSPEALEALRALGYVQ